MARLKRKMQRVEDSRLGTGDIVFIRAQVAAGASGEQDVILLYVDGHVQWAYRDMLWKYVITELPCSTSSKMATRQ
jgi:prepilin-type processing-associated H-X9-DG protein